VNECEVAVDPTRQEGGVLVRRLHDDAVPLEDPKVLREGEGDPGATLAESRVCDHVLAELFNEGDPWILDSPDLLWVLVGSRPKRRLLVDDPAVDAVRRSGGAEVRMPSAILDEEPSFRRRGAWPQG
jgi:hypothetical protein